MIYDVSSSLFRSFLSHGLSGSPKSDSTLALSLASRALPGDIVIDIVSCLPVISIVRFQLVHKSWRKLFCDPTFTGMHFNQTGMTSTEHFIYETSRWLSACRVLNSGAFLEGGFQRTLFEKLSVTFKVEDCSTGVICLLNLKPTPGAADLYFWNPAIRKVKLLPNYVRSPRDRLGFGFVPGLNDFKVVKMVHTEFFDETKDITIRMAPQVEVFSFRSNHWRRVRNVIPCVTFDETWAFVNDAVHWKVVSLTSGVAILAFDMVCEAFQIISLPSCYEPGFFNFVPKRHGESLSVVADVGDYWDIWVMKEYGVAASWSKQFKVGRIAGIYIAKATIVPTDFTKKGELLLRAGETCEDLMYLVKIDGSGATSFKFVGAFSHWDVYLCAENLVLLDGGDDVAHHLDLFPIPRSV